MKDILTLECEECIEDRMIMESTDGNNLGVNVLECCKMSSVTLHRPKVIRIVKWLIEAFSITAEELE